jgi:hypothetical protein
MKEHGETKITCPKCDGEAKQYFGNSNLTFWFKGACYERKNIEDCRRQMDLHALKENDPYAEHRVPGEVDHIIGQYHKASHSKHPTGKTDKKQKTKLCSVDGCLTWTTNRCVNCGSTLCTDHDSDKRCSCIKEMDVEPPTREELIKLLAEE